MFGGSHLLVRERNLILGALILLAAAAWGTLYWQAGQMGQHTMGLSMGMGPALFLAVWVIMMIAMMFPSAAPMILMFARVQEGKRQQGKVAVPTWLFVGGYLLIWTLFGVLAYAVAVVADQVGQSTMSLMDNAGRIGGAALILAGLYQVSPLKHVCLKKCRSPLAFIMTSWRDGYGGAFHMGLEHGLYCLGCCWLLFVILFPLGMMNIAILAAVSVVIFAEKVFPFGRRLAYLLAMALIAYGSLVVVRPDALPGMM